ncbi:oocyte zinc finger protein XlCOF26 [Drosophila serrata]|uniref:oocyte zinc finger protein XlCOF26 n=1 Tax=Drosophila serrata TaxID=7274 RepID=UPI000A1D255E|nr:oocyte zinc finger protein XlCOF26 [Drosophila serrata]
MSSQCRTCGQKTYSNSTIDIFEGNDVIIKQIALVTGLQLTDQLDFPKKMCFSCLGSLRGAIHFRELCVATNQRLILDTLDSGSENQDQEDFNDTPSSTAKLALKIKNIDDDVETEIIRQIKEIIEEDEAEYYNTHLQNPTNTKTTCNTSHGTQLIPQESTQKNVQKKSRATKIYFCDQCGREFNDRANLHLHLVRHTGIKPFECPDCGKREFNMYLLNIHIRVKHRGEKPFACKYCDKRFVDSTQRSRHQSRMHELKVTNKRYKCAFCNLRFEVKSQLKKHEVVHSGERNFPCEICNVSFTRNFNLKTHYRSKLHKKKAEKKSERNLE